MKNTKKTENGNLLSENVNFNSKKELNVLNTEIGISKGKSLENCYVFERAAGAPKLEKSKWESVVFLERLLFLSRINGNSEKWESTKIFTNET